MFYTHISYLLILFSRRERHYLMPLGSEITTTTISSFKCIKVSAIQSVVWYKAPKSFILVRKMYRNFTATLNSSHFRILQNFFFISNKLISNHRSVSIMINHYKIDIVKCSMNIEDFFCLQCCYRLEHSDNLSN